MATIEKLTEEEILSLVKTVKPRNWRLKDSYRDCKEYQGTVRGFTISAKSFLNDYYRLSVATRGFFSGGLSVVDLNGSKQESSIAYKAYKIANQIYNDPNIKIMHKFAEKEDQQKSLAIQKIRGLISQR